MSPAESVDLQAVSRVARNIELRDIWVIHVAASRAPAIDVPLEPKITFDCKGAMVEPEELNIVCDYTLTAGTGVRVQVTYLLFYEVTGDPPPTERDVEQFAKVNGVYHSWPFLRQLLHDLTAKMGLPPLTLPVFQVLSRTQTEDRETPSTPKKAKARKQALNE